MKKLLILFASIVLFASSCTYKTCPTYAKKPAAEPIEQAENM